MPASSASRRTASSAIELVTADGELRRVDHEHEPELFWALRGGGGNFGVVTALEVQLYEIPEIYAGVLFFPWERSSEVLHAWLDWTRTVPDEVTSVGRILQFPPLPELPDFLRGQQFVVVEAVFMGSEGEGAKLLEPLRALGPAIDTFAMVPPVGIAELHMDPPDPVPYTGEGMMLGELDAAAIDAFVAAAGPASGSPLVSAEIRHVGGELHRAKDGNGALATFDSAYLTFALGMVFDEETYAANRRQLALVRDALTPYDTGRQYLNFTEDHTDPATFYREDAYRRLRAVKAAVDPEHVFRANHPISGGVEKERWAGRLSLRPALTRRGTAGRSRRPSPGRSGARSAPRPPGRGFARRGSPPLRRPSPRAPPAGSQSLRGTASAR